MTDLPPPGWYPLDDVERYWDGQQWTADVRSPAPAEDPVPVCDPDPFPVAASSPRRPDPVRPTSAVTRPSLPSLPSWLSRGSRPSLPSWLRGSWLPRIRFRRPVLTRDRIPTLVLLGLILVVVIAAGAVELLRRPADPDEAVQAACTSAIVGTGATVRPASLRSVEGTDGRWTVGVEVTDTEGTRQWVCHVLWDGSRATLHSAVPGTS